MAIGNNHDDLVRFDAWRERRDGDAPQYAAPEYDDDELPPPSCEETVTELLTTTAGVIGVFIMIIVLVKAFG